MSYIKEMLEFNKRFVENKEYEKFATTKYPNKHIAILSCMDTRLTTLLPAALNLKNGDVKIIKNAGAVITHPFGSVMRSLLVGIYELGVNEIFVIGHHNCGMQALSSENMLDKMKRRGVTQDDLDFISYCGVDIDNWLKGFDNPEESVKATVSLIKKHPLIPSDISVSGYLIDPETGRLDVV